MIKRTILTLFALVLCLGVTSCGTDVSVNTEVRNSIYEIKESDMISFYMTSDVKPNGVWDYSIEGSIFEIFDETEETKKYGTFGRQSASYKTLILRPTEEGEAKITFVLQKTGETKEYNLAVTKDENGIFRIKAE